MKRIMLAVFAAIGLVALAGCMVVGPSRSSVYNLQYTTNYTIDGQVYICDSRETQVEYSFRYRGALPSKWEVSLVGVESGERITTVVHSPYDGDVEVLGGRISSHFYVPVNKAPTSIAPQIVIRRGDTRIEITVQQDGRSQTLRSSEIPVVTGLENCPTR